jgi:serine/threonine-protein kinase
LSFFNELKRRHVFQVTIAYVLVAWVVLQVADVLLNNLAAPDWLFKAILAVLIAGLPVTVVVSWIFDWTPTGLQRTDEVDGVGAPNSQVMADKASIAVLPFVNMSGDEENEYFSDGLTEELLNVLAKVEGVKVAARTSSFHFKGQTGNVGEIARRLGVATVLEGSVRKAGSRVRIAAQLINAADGYHLWSETFDRELDDIFAVQDEISAAVTDALQVTLLESEADAQLVGGTSNTDAFQAYLLGTHHLNKGDDKRALSAAIDAFEKAVKLDPNYAKAYVGLARAWAMMAANSFCTYKEGVSSMQPNVDKALELAPDLAEAHLALGYLRFTLQQDLHGAAEAFGAARGISPGSVEVQLEYARINCYQGHFDEAIAAARRAVELDPMSLLANHFLGHILYFSRHYEEAIPALRHTLAMEPNYPKPRYFISMSLFWLGEVEAAWEEIQDEPLDWMRWTASSVILHRLGRIDEAREVFANLSQEDEQEFATIQRADTYAQWGDTESAFRSLELAISYGDPGLSQLLVDPFLDPIRDDPRFKAMLEKLGFDE